MASGIGNAVFLSNVDDYISPSQACVNPIYGGGEQQQAEPNSNVVVPRQRKRETVDSTVVTATLADCLACSGCVTTAETVLLQERHNLSKLSTAIFEEKRPLVLTISPAAWADWERWSATSSTRTTRDAELASWKKYLGVVAVVDGNVPLQWSRTAAVDEFVEAWKKAKETKKEEPMMSDTEAWERDLVPSKALGQSRSEFYVGGNAKQQAHLPQLRLQQQLPLISSSCPAIVCYMETSHHSGVPHLSVVKSPMMMAAAVANKANSDSTQLTTKRQHFHVAIQPCHDKKLEAGRLDFGDDTLDIVLTTSEWFQFVQEHVAQSDTDDEPMPPPPETHTVDSPKQFQTLIHGATDQEAVILCVAPQATRSVSSTSTTTTSNTAPLFLTGSGGFAETTFRQASFRLFGVSVAPHWIQPGAQRRRTRNREHYEATLYRRSDGTLTSNNNNNNEDLVVVWRFAIAYGLQTVQRILGTNDWRDRYDYMEIMACAGSCLNGAGQLTESSSPETPPETRKRLAATREQFNTLDTHCSQATRVPSPYTTYHIVPPLQHTLGAAAGVAVQDTQW